MNWRKQIRHHANELEVWLDCREQKHNVTKEDSVSWYLGSTRNVLKITMMSLQELHAGTWGACAVGVPPSSSSLSSGRWFSRRRCPPDCPRTSP